jgi:hypothetical protein
VKRFSSVMAAAASDDSDGNRPVRIAGTACTVNPATVVLLRYQVEVPARRAKFGNCSASTRPVPSSSEAVGSASNTISTTSGGSSPRSAATARATSSSIVGPPVIRPDAGDISRNCTRKTTDATPTKRRNDAVVPTDARRYARARPPTRPAIISFCQTASPPMTATSARCSRWRTVGPSGRPARPSRPSARKGPKATTSPNSTTVRASAPRATKVSGDRPKVSSTARPNAKAARPPSSTMRSASDRYHARPWSMPVVSVVSLLGVAASLLVSGLWSTVVMVGAPSGAAAHGFGSTR